MKSRRRVYRQIKPSSNIKAGGDRETNGFAYTVIPNDLPRDEYLKIVYQTGYVMLMTSKRELLREVKVPNHLIDTLTFPEEQDEYGDLVSWSAVDSFNQLYITGVYTKPGQFHPYLENVNVKHYNSQYKITRSVDGNVPVYMISLDSEDLASGVIEFRAKGGGGVSSIRLKTDGSIEVNADDKVIGVFENSIQMQIGTKKGEISTIKFEKDVGLTYTDQFDNTVVAADGNVSVNSKKINLGQGSSPAVLGDKLNELLQKLITQVAAITVLGSSPGTPTSPPTNIVAINQLSSELSALLSSKVILE